MLLLELEKIAKREKINIVNNRMRKTKARIIECDNTCIFMDYSKIHSYIEEKCLLAEELNVEPNMVEFAYKYYTENNQLKINANSI